MSEHRILYEQQVGSDRRQAVCSCGTLIAVPNVGLGQTVASQFAKHIRNAVPTRADRQEDA